MNIAPSTATAVAPTPPSSGAAPTSTVPDDGSTGHIVPDTGDGVDVPAGQGATSTGGFGSMLSKHLDDLQEGDAGGKTTPRGIGGLDVKLDVKLDSKSDAADAPDASLTDPADKTTTVAAASGVGAVVPQDLFPTLAATTTTTTSSAMASGLTNGLQASRDGLSRKGRSDDDRTKDSDAGSDLAAQLALASQWTSAAKPVDAATPTSSAPDAVVTGAARGGFDVKALFGKFRATTGKDDAAAKRVDATAADAGAANASSAASSLAAAASSGDAQQTDDPGMPANTPLVAAAKDGDAKTRDDLALAALDAASMAAAGTTTRADTVAAGDAFAMRLAAHVSNTTTTSATSASSSATSIDAAANAYVQEPVGSPGWSHEVGQATLRMAANDLQSASIRLNPEHLGPLDVQVRVDNGVAHVSFSATHVDTQAALEASRGTLDQLFTSQGLKMGDVSVSAGSSGGAANDAFAARGDQGADASRRDGGNRWSGDVAANDNDGPVTTIATRISRASSLVDTFA